MSSRHVHLRGLRSKNVADRIAGVMPITGVARRTLSHVPNREPVCKKSKTDKLTSPEVEVIEMVRPALTKLEIGENWNPKEGLTLMMKVLAFKKGFGTGKSLLSEEHLKEVISLFVDEYKAIDLIVAILTSETKKDLNKRNSKLEKLCLEMLSRLCLMDSKLSEQVCEREEILLYCFHSLPSLTVDVSAAKMIELILLARKEPMNLCAIPNVHQILSQLKGEGLGNFCKILSVLLSDTDVCQFRSSLRELSKHRKSVIYKSVREMNHDLVMSVPPFLENLVNFLCEKDHIGPRYPNASREQDHWFHYIENQVTSVSEGPNEDALLTYGAMDVMTEIVSKVEGLYVLGLLLSGKHRKEVLCELVRLRLIPKLNVIFDSFIFKTARSNFMQYLLDHSGFDVSPESALKVQFLRVVHCFAEHNEMKYVMLTPSEWEEMVDITKEMEQRSTNQGTEESMDTDSKTNNCSFSVVKQLEPSLMSTGSEGLLVKLVEVLKKEHSLSTYRFWLCRALESYLRGNVSYADQMFLVKRGLLHHVIRTVITSNARHKEMLQAALDLVGELVKFNGDAMQIMNEVLRTDSNFTRFLYLINDKLVDSNMYIRAMILNCQRSANLKGSQIGESRLMSYFADFQRQTNYVAELVDIMEVNSLTQENVSCLNTSLVILMLARRNNRLLEMLNGLRNYGDGEDKGKKILANLKQLLKFWHEHYLGRLKDCSHLEKSSQIPFDYWKATVEVLLDDERTCHTSLQYHIATLT